MEWTASWGQWLGFALMAISGCAWAFDAARRSLGRGGAQGPGWAQSARAAFPLLAAVFVFRSFFYEPFSIPSASMEPGVATGDFILVEKFSYGLMWPLTTRRALSWGGPRRGDAVVFKYPPNPSTDFIKRVIGAPGDRVVYHRKRLTVNGRPAAYRRLGDLAGGPGAAMERWEESWGGASWVIFNDPRAPALAVSSVMAFKNHQACSYSREGFECVVPSGHYFMMGDNRDHSSDSRYWGFVREDKIIGRAALVWMNWSDPSRAGRLLRDPAP